MSERYVSATELEAAHKAMLSVLANTYHLLAYAHRTGTTSAELLASDDEAIAAFAKTQFDAMATDLRFARDKVMPAGRYFPASEARLSNCSGTTWHEAALMLATTVHGIAYGRFADACLRTQERRPTPEIWESCWLRIQDGLQGVEQFDLDATRAALTREHRAADEKLRAGDFEPTVETLLKRCAEMRQFVHRLDEQSPSLFWTRRMILDCWEDMVRIDPSATLPPRPDAIQLTTVSVVAGAIEAIAQWCEKRAGNEPQPQNADKLPAMENADARHATGGKRPATVNERMAAMVQTYPLWVSLTAKEWAEKLGCTDSNVRQTDTWTITIRGARAMMKADQLK